MMTRSKAKKSARTAKGRLKEAVGRVTGNRRMTAEGKTEQVKARVGHMLDKGMATLRHVLGSSDRFTHRFNR
jgi:uncharacterized protein YjbJ (UPF0337 family)